MRAIIVKRIPNHRCIVICPYCNSEELIEMRSDKVFYMSHCFFTEQKPYVVY